MESSITLVFSPSVPQPGIAGLALPLLVSDDPQVTGAKGGHKPAWMIGKHDKYCDVVVAPVFDFISRIHCTIYCDRDTGGWFIVDGGSYPRTKNAPATYSPSSNGVWLNGKRIKNKLVKTTMPDGRVVERYTPNPEPLAAQDRIWLGPEFKIIVSHEEHPTVIPDAWEGRWHDIERSEDDEPELEIELREQTDRNSKPSKDGWKSDVVELFQRATWAEKFYYGALLLLGIAISIGLPLLLAGASR